MDNYEQDGASVIRSMTGYGRQETGPADNRFLIEIRSLNNRYLDIQVKTPRGLASMEAGIKKAVQDRFSRGRFEIFVSRNGEREKNGKLAIDEALAGQYVGVLNDLKMRFGLGGEVDINLIAGIPGLITLREVKEDEEALWLMLQDGLSRSLDDLDRMRAEEGAVLVRDINARMELISSAIQEIRKQTSVTVENARKRMADTLSRLLNEQPDPIRLTQEIAILAERTDVTEELTRLGSHLAQFRSLVDGATGDAVGRKLDFLLQEIGREVNTIASKAMDAKISLDVVTIKAELEKIREQVQNIE